MFRIKDLKELSVECELIMNRKDYYKNRICFNCRYFCPELHGWENKCLKFTNLYNGVSRKYLRERVLPLNECRFFRPPFVSHKEEERLNLKQYNAELMEKCDK